MFQRELQLHDNKHKTLPSSISVMSIICQKIRQDIVGIIIKWQKFNSNQQTILRIDLVGGRN